MRATGLVAAGVISGSILAGTLGAQAATPPDGHGATSTHVPGPPMGRMHHGGPQAGADLARALGVSQARLQQAFAAIRDDVRPARRPNGPPTAAERKAMKDKVAAALGDELGISKAKVLAALEKVRTEHRAERRDALGRRLNKAVKNGKLTADDKASVLKAFDAGVLGGPGRR